MRYVGLDVHTKRSSICILDEHGKRVKQELIKGPRSAVVERLRQEPGPISICFEASCGYGYLYEKLSPLAAAVTVAHPGQTRLIFKSKKKHDRIDAEKLAKLLYLDAVPRAYVPQADVRSWRKLIEYRQKLVARRVACKNQVRAVLRGEGIEAEGFEAKALWTKKGLAWLETLQLPLGPKLAVELAIEELQEHTGRMRRVEKELAQLADQHPGVQLLMSIPGVGIRTAEAFAAYVDDVKRFTRSRQVGSYFGLVPCQDSSAGKDRFGHITRDGPATVRKLLIEAAWQAAQRDPASKALFERVMNNDPGRKKIAIVAVAHRLCRVMAALLRSGEAYRLDQAEALDGAEEGAEGRPSAGGEGLSPPEDTAARKPAVF